jgi:hypothetical protein
VAACPAADPERWRHGYDLACETGLQAGSLSPILMRLDDRGLLVSRWEADPGPGRPPRHLYRLTGPGMVLARQPDPAEARGPVGFRGVPRSAS